MTGDPKVMQRYRIVPIRISMKSVFIRSKGYRTIAGSLKAGWPETKVRKIRVSREPQSPMAVR